MIKLMKYFFFLDSTWTKHCQGKGDEIENKCPRLRMVWVSCEGETAADKGGLISEGILKSSFLKRPQKFEKNLPLVLTNQLIY